MASPHYGVCLLGLRCPERLSQRISISYIMVHSVRSSLYALLTWPADCHDQNLPRPYHDANLGLPSVPSVTQCPLCSKPHRGCRFSWSQTINQHCCNGTRGHCYSRNRLSDRFHDFVGLHIPPHDAEASAGYAETRYRTHALSPFFNFADPY